MTQFLVRRSDNDRDAFARFDIHLGADVSHARDQLDDCLHLRLNRFVNQISRAFRKSSQHHCGFSTSVSSVQLLLARQTLPQLFSDVRHKRMQQPQRLFEHCQKPRASFRARSALLFGRETIQRSWSAVLCLSISGLTPAPSELSRQNLAAFQILFAKFRYDSTCLSFQRTSVLPTCARVSRVASTPNLSNTSIGSTPFIFVFDIRWPWLSRIVPVMKTWAKGSLPANFVPIITIRDTQRKMMSRAVTRTDVG